MQNEEDSRRTALFVICSDLSSTGDTRQHSLQIWIENVLPMAKGKLNFQTVNKQMFSSLAPAIPAPGPAARSPDSPGRRVLRFGSLD